MTYRLLLPLALAMPLLSQAADVPPSSSRLSQLSAQWWQWTAAIPDDINPVRDLTGMHCAQGQSGKVWFLAGGFGSSKIRRNCTVPAGKSLFFPLINMVYLPRHGGSGYTCAQAKSSAALNNDTALDLFAELDGVAIGQLRQGRAGTPACFDFFGKLPTMQRPYDGFPSASDGFWLLLQPLSKGRHTLAFGGRYNRASPQQGRMVQDIEYVLTVK